MKKLILTGAGGFVGSRIAHHLKDRYEKNVENYVGDTRDRKINHRTFGITKSTEYCRAEKS